MLQRLSILSALLLMGFSSTTFAKDLTNRLGVGYANQFGVEDSNGSEGIPSLAVRYYPNSDVGISGQIGIDPATNILVEGFDAQLEQVMKNIDGLLESENLTREHILKTSIFLTDLGQFSKVNIAYEEFFKAPYPARSCVEVPNLPKGAVVEIEVIAARNVQ